MTPWGRHSVVIVALVLVAGGCGGQDGAATSTPGAMTAPWIEQDLTFPVGSVELHGILTAPAPEGLHPAVVIAAPSVGPAGGHPSGVSDRYQTDLARRLAEVGYAALRYDPPGVGRSGGDIGLQDLAAQADQVTAALQRLTALPVINGDQVGLWGASQQAWVIATVAAERPEEVAFIISVSGSGVSVAQQQIYGIEAQSRAAGLQALDVERATLFGRLLVDWQLTDPQFRVLNEQTAKRLGPGPWRAFSAVVYEPDPRRPADNLNEGIAILMSIQENSWAAALNLDTVVLPALRGVPPDQITAARAAAEDSLLVDRATSSPESPARCWPSSARTTSCSPPRGVRPSTPATSAKPETTTSPS